MIKEILSINSNTNVKRQTDVEYRKIQGLVGEYSFSLVLPKSYATNLNLAKGDFVKVYQDENKIVIEKA